MLERISSYINKYLILLVIIIGCILRLIYIGRVPGDYTFFSDEAFSAYEAYSLLNYGMDSHGYHYPVFLEAWGSGMSAVQCYSQMFWIKLLGFEPQAIRLPQALLGCLTLPFLYLLIKEISNFRVAIWSTFIFAISPWHITTSRWGQACNYFVAFITIAMYLIISSRNVMWRTILAAVVTGLAFYSSSYPWIVMPLLVYGTITILYIRKEMNKKSIAIFTMVLTIIVFPLCLFLAVNLGLISEFNFLFMSIPKLRHFSLWDGPPTINRLIKMLSVFWTQFDAKLCNAVSKYGIYYLFSNVFLMIGLAKDLIKKNKNSAVMWLWLICGFILGTMSDIGFDRLNILMIPLFYFIGSGVVFLIELFEKYKTIDKYVLAIVYLVACISFVGFYFTDYNVMMMRELPIGAKEAIEFAEQYDGTIHVSDISYPTVLCYSKYPVDKYVKTVVYQDDNNYLQPVCYEGYDYRDFTESTPVSGDIYICSVNNTETVAWLSAHDMSFAQFGTFYLGVAN